MAVRETIQIGHPALKAKNEEVTDFNDPKIKEVIQDLIDTMRDKGLVGMAAPQIAENYRIFITEPRVTPTRTIDQADELRVYINPEIVETSGEEVVIFEGCGSVMNGQLFGPVKRPKVVTIEAFNESGEKFRLKCDGLLSRVIQHEYDHLKGIEFTEKVYDYKKLMTFDFYIQNIKNSPEQTEPSKITVKEYTLL